MALPEVVIYSKPACCLCDRAKRRLVKLQEQHAFVLREVNILEDPAAYKMLREEIPVVFVNGKKAFKYHLDEKAFIRMLESCDATQHPENASAR